MDYDILCLREIILLYKEIWNIVFAVYTDVNIKTRSSTIAVMSKLIECSNSLEEINTPHKALNSCHKLYNFIMNINDDSLQFSKFYITIKMNTVTHTYNYLMKYKKMKN